MAGGRVTRGLRSAPRRRRIAGRARSWRRSADTSTAGTGLLLVTGEAGIGKTRLVDTAGGWLPSSVFVARGACRPLSTEVPLLPIADVLRATYGADTASGSRRR